MVLLTIEIPIKDLDPVKYIVRFIMLQDSFPVTVPIVHFIKDMKWINKDGYVTPDIMCTYSSTDSISKFVLNLINLIRKKNIYICKNNDINTNVVIKTEPLDNKSYSYLYINESDLTKPDNNYKDFFGEDKIFTYKNNKVMVSELYHGFSKTNLDYAEETISILQQINHPYIIKIFGIVNTDKKTLLVTKFSFQGDLITFIKNRDQQLEKYTSLFCQIFKKLAKAVDALHKRNIIHRDIKPTNVFMDKRDNPLLGGFHFVRLLDPNTNEDITRCGTAIYAAPEMFDVKKVVTNKCDIYELALVGYFIMTGKDIAISSFIDECQTKKLNDSYTLPIDPYLNPILYNLFSDCLSFDPKLRPSADEIVERLKDYKGPLYTKNLE
ncbi:hypothetical protein WA158_000249 [Blastocystis sp. Blastoise]